MEPMAAEESLGHGLITIESDQQSADNSTGVVTASENVRIVHADRGVVATSRQLGATPGANRSPRRCGRGAERRACPEGGSGHLPAAEDRAKAVPVEGGQVFSQWSLKAPSSGNEP